MGEELREVAEVPLWVVTWEEIQFSLYQVPQGSQSRLVTISISTTMQQRGHMREVEIPEAWAIYHRKFKTQFETKSNKMVKILPRRAVEKIYTFVKSLPLLGQNMIVYDPMLRPMGLLQLLKTSLVSFQFMDLGSNTADNIFVPARFRSTVLLWNCRGLVNSNALDTTRDLCSVHKPEVLILTETRLDQDRALEMARRPPFDSCMATQTTGRREGILFLWNSEAVQASHVATTEQEIQW